MTVRPVGHDDQGVTINMRPRFVIVNVIVVGLAYSAARLGLFNGIPPLGPIEGSMVGFLFLYAVVGAIAAFMGRWRTTIHIANSLPMWALAFTGLGLVLAVSGLHDLSPHSIAVVFKALAYAIIPNIAGVALMAWLREVAWWSAGEEV